MAAFEERVQMLWQASADSHHICRTYGVSCLSEQAVLVMKLYPHSLATDMVYTQGQLHSLLHTLISACELPYRTRCILRMTPTSEETAISAGPKHSL